MVSKKGAHTFIWYIVAYGVIQPTLKKLSPHLFTFWQKESRFYFVTLTTYMYIEVHL